MFTDVFIGMPGRVHDARVFRSSPLYRRITGDPPLMLGGQHLSADVAYPLMKNVLKHYRDDFRLTQRQIRFNQVLAAQRSAIERTFGLLKGKWRRLKYLDMSLENEIPEVIHTSACILHNFTLKQNDFELAEVANQDVIDINEDNEENTGSIKRDFIASSPYSNNAYVQDDYDDDDRFDDEEDRENEDPQEESDEDTEDASETDTGRHEEPLEIKEQMYQDKLASLKKKLQQLKDGTHHDYNKKVRKLEYQYKERIRLNTIYRDYMIECVERDYILEKKAAVKDFEEKQVDLRENLLSDFEDKRKAIESERYSMELTGDSMEVKPVMTRKLRRRPNDPVPVPEKRRKPATCQPVFLLDEKEIENDLKNINRGKVLTPVRKPAETPHTSQGVVQSQSMQVSSNVNEVPLVETRFEDGKLLYERRWFHRGQSVYIEGKDMPRFPASISAIASEVIWVKKADSTKVKIHIANLARGKVSIKRRAS